MILKHLSLEHFRNHQKSSFDFDKTTLIIGKNTAGKTNIIESIYILSHGKSFRGEDRDAIGLGSDYARITTDLIEIQDKESLVVVFSSKNNRFSKRFLVNNVVKRQADFVAQFYSVLFTPQDIEIITDSPSLRRKYIDSILNQASKPYRVALMIYEKALRHRNKMLYDLREGRKYYKPQDFDYWNSILIENGTVITAQREAFVDFVNHQKKDIFDFQMIYDKSLMNESRLEKYYDAERAAAVTLVGPQRDDFLFFYKSSENPIQEFGSRGEQRLTLLQLKVFEIEYLKNSSGEYPTLLLDDIFSELDATNIEKVFHLIDTQQTIITTTHREFVPKKILDRKDLKIIEL